MFWNHFPLVGWLVSWGLQDKAACSEKSQFRLFVDQRTVQGLFCGQTRSPQTSLCWLEACKEFMPYHKALFIFMCYTKTNIHSEKSLFKRKSLLGMKSSGPRTRSLNHQQHGQVKKKNESVFLELLRIRIHQVGAGRGEMWATLKEFTLAIDKGAGRGYGGARSGTGTESAKKCPPLGIRCGQQVGKFMCK